MSGRRIATVAAGLVLAAGLALAAGCASPTGPVANTTNQKIREKTQSQEATINAAIAKAQKTVTEVAQGIGTVEAQNKGQRINAKLDQLQKELNDALHATGSAKITAVNNVSTAFNTSIKNIEDAAKAAPSGSAKQTALNNLAAKLKSAQAQLAAAAAGAK